MHYPGGYMCINAPDLEINISAAVTFKNARMAENIRNCRKPIIVTCKFTGGLEVMAVCQAVSDTGARDGRVFQFTAAEKVFSMFTNDDEITIRPNE